MTRVKYLFGFINFLFPFSLCFHQLPRDQWTGPRKTHLLSHALNPWNICFVYFNCLKILVPYSETLSTTACSFPSRKCSWVFKSSSFPLEPALWWCSLVWRRSGTSSKMLFLVNSPSAMTSWIYLTLSLSSLPLERTVFGRIAWASFWKYF